MAAKADFSPDEWKSLIAAPSMVGLAISAASPNGPFGVVKEMFAVGMAMAEVIQKGSNNPLISALCEDIKARATRPEPPAGLRSADQIKQAALDHLKKVGALLKSKAAGDAPGFSVWLNDIGTKVAEASNEGGLFGIGGTRVSDAEKAMLADIRGALG